MWIIGLQRAASATHCVASTAGSALIFFASQIAAAGAAPSSAPILLTVNDFGDAGPGNCAATCTLRDALHDIADGGIIEFAPDSQPQTITLAHGPLIIMKSMTILGPGPRQLAISAGKLSRVLSVLGQDGQHVLVAGVTLRDGSIVGTNGADGTNGASNSTVNGQSGGSVGGGCLSAGSIEPKPSSLALEQVDVRECEAIGGDGGAGGTGSTGTGLSTGGQGGAGGSGGSAQGAGIFVNLYPGSTVTLGNLSVINAAARGGNAGPGGDGGPGFLKGKGGAGGFGGSGSGGAIFIATGITAELRNSTIADSEATGGNGADGGDGDPGLVTAPGGNGGNGGSASGGLVTMLGLVGSITFTTLTHGSLTAGAPANGGAGAVGGAPGTPGIASGIAIYSSQATAVATVVVGPASASATLCYGIAARPGYVNLDEDGSCDGFTLHGSLAELFRPLDLSGTAWPAYMPAYHSRIIDAAPCSDGTLQPPTDDQHGTPRPQGAQCDIGSIEADYVFVDGFN